MSQADCSGVDKDSEQPVQAKWIAPTARIIAKNCEIDRLLLSELTRAILIRQMSCSWTVMRQTMMPRCWTLKLGPRSIISRASRSTGCDRSLRTDSDYFAESAIS